MKKKERNQKEIFNEKVAKNFVQEIKLERKCNQDSEKAHSHSGITKQKNKKKLQNLNKRKREL